MYIIDVFLFMQVFNFIGFMCIACTNGTSAKGDAFLAASIGAFIITAIFLVIYVLDIQERVGIPWIKIQFFYCVIWGLFYLITAALVIDLGSGYVDSYVAGGVSYYLFISLLSLPVLLPTQ